MRQIGAPCVAFHSFVNGAPEAVTHLVDVEQAEIQGASVEHVHEVVDYAVAVPLSDNLLDFKRKMLLSAWRRPELVAAVELVQESPQRDLFRSGID